MAYVVIRIRSSVDHETRQQNVSFLANAGYFDKVEVYALLYVI